MPDWIRRLSSTFQPDADLAGDILRLVPGTLRAIGDAPDLATGLRVALERMCDRTGWDVGEAWILSDDTGTLRLGEAWTRTPAARTFVDASRAREFRPGTGLVGRAWASREWLWRDELSTDPDFDRKDLAAAVPLQAGLAIPVVAEDRVIAVLMLLAGSVRDRDDRAMAFIAAIVNQLGALIRWRRTEASLRESEATLGRLFECAPDAIVAVDPQGHIVRANAQAEATFGYRRDELRGRPVEVLLPDRFAAHHPAHRDEFFAAPRERPMGEGLQLFGLRKDGSEFPVDINLTPVGAPGRQVVMAVVRDLTERREAARRFRRLLEAATDAFVIVASDGRIVLVNSRTERTFGYPRAELIGAPARLLVPEPHRRRADDEIAAFFREPRVGHFGANDGPIAGRRRDGSTFPIELDLSPLPTPTAGTLAMVAIRDITERRRAERERDHLMAELQHGRERLQSLSTRLLEAQETERRTIARELHDQVGQALTAMSLDLYELQQSVPSALHGLVDGALVATRRIVSQVRELSLDLRPSLLDDLGLAAALRWYLERHERRLGCRVRFVDELGDVRVPAPIETAAFRFAQEALTNVARHASASEVTVELRIEHDTLRVAVRDDGIGFDPPAARARAIAGGSLGLLGMEERVALAGGTLDVTSALGRGANVCAAFAL